LEAAKKTPLYPQHLQLKAKIVNFGGWSMPVSYEGVLAEHKTVREAVGLFDVSHMGEIRIVGKKASDFLNHLLTNDVKTLSVGQGQYSAMCNEQGGFIDDLIVYKLKNDEYLLCVNAGNTENDYSWIETQSDHYADVQVRNESEAWAQLALQGPSSLQALQSILDMMDQDRVEKLPYMHIFSTKLFGLGILIARTGYTGEHGYEIYVPPSLAQKVWTALLEKNQKLGIKPIGLGARDTLRLEACYLLYGNDMDDSVSPLEAGIGWAVKLEHNFVGKKVIAAQKKKGIHRKLLAFRMIDAGIPRHGMHVLQNGKPIGLVTSGSVLPSVGGAGGMALIMTDQFDASLEISIDVRGNLKRAAVVPKPLYNIRAK